MEGALGISTLREGDFELEGDRLAMNRVFVGYPVKGTDNTSEICNL